jgi:hypothetical protein
MARLDDPQLQTDLLTAVGRLGSVALAAPEIGLSRRSISTYLKAHPELADAVAVARRRHEVLETQAASPPRSLGPALPESSGCGALTPAGRREFIALLEAHAADGTSKGCSKALDILAQLHLAREFLELKAEARRVETEATAGDMRPAVIRMPAPSQTPRIIEAEIVDGQ